ncbi:unnamed protein product [Cunninghamella echinulata]
MMKLLSLLTILFGLYWTVYSLPNNAENKVNTQNDQENINWGRPRPPYPGWPRPGWPQPPFPGWPRPGWPQPPYPGWPREEQLYQLEY